MADWNGFVFVGQLVYGRMSKLSKTLGQSGSISRARGAFEKRKA